MPTECPFCGRKTGPQDRYCAGCGTALESFGEQPAEPTAAQASFEDQEVLDLAKHNKIAAIKRFREIHNVGLAEAKHAVEQLMVRHGVVADSGKAIGCAGMLMLAAGWSVRAVMAMLTGLLWPR